MPRFEENIDAVVKVTGTANVGLVYSLGTFHWPSAQERDQFLSTFYDLLAGTAGSGLLGETTTRPLPTPMQPEAAPRVSRPNPVPMPPLREPDRFKTVGPVNPDGTPGNGARRVDATLQA